MDEEQASTDSEPEPGMPGHADSPDAREESAPEGEPPSDGLDATRAEIERGFGLVPSFFMLARDTPEIMAALYDLTRFAYLDAPMPSLFKERLFTYLSHFWTEIHPELALEPDIDRLLDEQRTLADWVQHYQERVREELTERIGTELDLLEELRRRAEVAEQANVALSETVQERTRAATQAEAANRAKSNFLAAMSHELRTPLNAILGYADLLAAEVTGGLTEGQRTQVDRLRDSGRHLLGLVDQVLSLSRIEAHRETVEAGPVDAAELARDTAAMVQPQAERKGLDFSLRRPAASGGRYPIVRGGGHGGRHRPGGPGARFSQLRAVASVVDTNQRRRGARPKREPRVRQAPGRLAQL